MVRPQLTSEKPISIGELKLELEKIKERDKELNLRGNKTEEYLNQFLEIEPKKLNELRKRLEELKLSRLKEEYIIKILDTLPKTANELKTLLQGYTISISQEDMKKVIGVIEESLKK